MKSVQDIKQEENDKVMNIATKEELELKQAVHLEMYFNRMTTPVVKHFFFLRHGSTDWNPTMLSLGPQDLSLNTKGIKQVLNAVTKLQGVNIGCAITSNLKRCYETKDLFVKLTNFNKTVEVSETLQERNFGNWSLYKESIDNILDNVKDYKDVYKQVQSIVESNLPKDAETKDQFEMRIIGSITSYLQQNTLMNPLIIGHGCVKSVIMKFMRLEDYMIDYGGVLSFEFLDVDNAWHVSHDVEQYKTIGDSNE